MSPRDSLGSPGGSVDGGVLVVEERQETRGRVVPNLSWGLRLIADLGIFGGGF